MARLGVHDTAKHLKNLLTALLEQTDHTRFADIEPLTHEVLELTGDISKTDGHPDRVVHGDPKISNVIFDPDTDGAICLIDFDTISRMPVVLELGDAFRSWCNPHSEDADRAEFSLPLFEAAIAGYARETRDFLTELEWHGVPGAIYTITVELAARFCADALNECCRQSHVVCCCCQTAFLGVTAATTRTPSAALRCARTSTGAGRAAAGPRSRSRPTGATWPWPSCCSTRAPTCTRPVERSTNTPED